MQRFQIIRAAHRTIPGQFQGRLHASLPRDINTSGVPNVWATHSRISNLGVGRIRHVLLCLVYSRIYLFAKVFRARS